MLEICYVLAVEAGSPTVYPVVLNVTRTCYPFEEDQTMLEMQLLKSSAKLNQTYAGFCCSFILVCS